jgi:hypothetical protein
MHTPLALHSLQRLYFLVSIASLKDCGKAFSPETKVAASKKKKYNNNNN